MSVKWFCPCLNTLGHGNVWRSAATMLSCNICESRCSRIASSLYLEASALLMKLSDPTIRQMSLMYRTHSTVALTWVDPCPGCNHDDGPMHWGRDELVHEERSLKLHDRIIRILFGIKISKGVILRNHKQ